MTDQSLPSHHGPDEDATGSYPNATMRLLMERGSLRQFTDELIPTDVLQQILAAGAQAASGGNLQPFSIIQTEDTDTRKKLADWLGQSFIGKAPVLLTFCIDLRRLQRWAALDHAPFTADHSFRHFWISFQDTIIAAQNICTAADALGLGSVYIGSVLEYFRELKELFDLPQGVFPVVLLCLGYPAERPKPRTKLPVDVIVHKETYQELGDQGLLDVYAEKYAGQTYEITDQRMELFTQVCTDVGGEEFAQECIRAVQEAGHFNQVQRYFGLHYRANIMPEDNSEYLQTLEDFGFYWMHEYENFGE
jgi:FMN reductase [NAD(P)H]